MLNRFYELVTKLQSTNGRLEKEGYLREVADDTEVLQILKFLFDPYVVSGISDKKLNKFRKQVETTDLPLLNLTPAETHADQDPTPDTQNLTRGSFLDALEYFRTHNTGRDEDVKYLVSVAESSVHPDLVYAVVKRDLKLGIQATTLNKVFGTEDQVFVPKFDVMLAESYADNREFVEGKEFIITEKLDGVRCLLMFSEPDENGNVVPTFFSRQGQAIMDLVELVPQVENLPKEFVYDGELLLDDKNNTPSKDLYRMTVKVTSSDNVKRGVIFNMFDMLPKENFLRGEDPTPAVERKSKLRDLLSGKATLCPNLKDVKMHYTGTDTAEIDIYLNKFISAGGEGIMVNITNGAYQCKRTKNILKVKQFNTADVEVIEIEEGSGANRGKLGAVVVKFLGPDGKPYTCKVGSGFKLSERDHFWAHPEEIMGKIIEIGYFEMSRNQNNEDYSLRFPTFKHTRPDKTEISMY